MQTHIASQIEILREQLSQQLARRGAEDPYVEHLRWQIASLERQARRQDAAADGPAAQPIRAGGDRSTGLRARLF